MGVRGAAEGMSVNQRLKLKGRRRVCWSPPNGRIGSRRRVIVDDKLIGERAGAFRELSGIRLGPQSFNPFQQLLAKTFHSVACRSGSGGIPKI